MSATGRRIADVVHGTIELSALEADLVQTRSFQRLRGVKQLGLVEFVFPGANYSRFSHCIGVNHVTARLVNSLQARSSQDLGDERIYRAAALLHDVGHYPFSHAMEDAVADVYKQSLLTQSTGEEASSPLETDYLNHEKVGMRVMEMQTDINAVLKAHDVDPGELASIIGHKTGAPVLANLVSSDLDADRIDYLLRTAKHTGLPYGRIDLDYILAMVSLDSEGRICLDARAMRTAEHLLLARYFDYQQVVHHKTVTAFEELLKSVLRDLTETGLLDCRRSSIEARLQDPDSWLAFDDAYIWQLIRKLVGDPGSEAVRLRATALLARRGPKLIGSAEFFSERPDNRRDLQDLLKHVKKAVNTVASVGEIDPSLVWVWSSKSQGITTLGSRIFVSEREEIDPEEESVAVRVAQTGGGSRPLVELDSSLLKVLSNYSLGAVRLYALPPEPEPQDWRSTVAKAVADEIWVFRHRCG